MDTEAVIARRPKVVCVDELAHTNVPGSRHEKRAHDVEEIRAAGIDVITTVNIQHLESLNDEVERITGVRQRETVPDDVVRTADNIQLVDMSPEALRRRMAHGNIYRPENVDASLTLTSGSATSPHSASSRCSGGRPGRRRSRRLPQDPPDPGDVARQGADRRGGHRRRRERDADPARRPAGPRAAGSELLAVHVSPPTACAPRRDALSRAQQLVPASAAPSTPSPARTSRPRSWTSRRAPTPR